MKFTKMQGCGNDFIFIDCAKAPPPEDIAGKTVRWCGRHFGVGADGVILLLPHETCDLRMRLVNADGSDAEMCGNAIRCVAKYLYERMGVKKDAYAVMTGRGKLTLLPKVENGVVTAVTVNMGEPILDGPSIPVAASDPRAVEAEGFSFCCVSMGNPHAVTFVDDLAAVDFYRLGPLVERSAQFPNRVNVEFAQVLPDGIHVKVWERGAGETLACGTGACAVLVAASLCGLAGREADVHLPGGTLHIKWDEDGAVYMTGPAEFVFDGEIG